MEEQTQMSFQSAREPTGFKLFGFTVTKLGNDDDEEEESKMFQCRLCAKKFPNPQALGGHQNAHKKRRQKASRIRFRPNYGWLGTGRVAGDGHHFYEPRLHSQDFKYVPAEFLLGMPFWNSTVKFLNAPPLDVKVTGDSRREAGGTENAREGVDVDLHL